MITREKYHHYDESVDYESALDYNIPNMKEKLCYIKELLKDKDYSNDQKRLLAYSSIILDNEYHDERIYNIIDKVLFDFSLPFNDDSLGQTIYNYNLLSDNPKLTIKKVNICTQYRNLIRIQSTLLHELRHIVTCLNDSMIDLGNGEIYSRMGLRQEIFNTKKNTSIRIGNNIDEVYNTYITDMNMTKLLALKKHTQSHYLNRLKNPQPSGYYQSGAYQELISFMYPLLLCEELTKCADESAYIGDVSSYRDMFNNLFSNIINVYDFMLILDNNELNENNKKMVLEMYNQYNKFVK